MSWRLRMVGEAHAIAEVPEVVGKQRPRYSRKLGRPYTPSKTRVFEECVRKAWREQVGEGWAEFSGAVTVTVAMTRELAKSNPKKWAGRQDVQKPDADNVLKSCLDALNGLAYSDDAHITRELAEKMPRTPHGSGNQISIHCIYYEEEFEK
ncbi:RusA family crossover junction endodeoxyribonuclease [Collinsella sp. An2]|uniref:RusA family crossover junction endodeoxyribonuclease n=1 Tax=Collinsella sp. An2 TaxID=1965585 RepID=UPI000B37A125|nr:RusA family crossover junction endodeoxyribonuclease [Collinsella sp. An2]OUP10968.1 hypothetical protein B5F33_00875 [Collinsella sp. An2]